MKETSKQEQIMMKGTFYAMKASFVKATTIILSQTLLASNIGNIRSATSLKHEALISPFVIKRKKRRERIKGEMMKAVVHVHKE